MPHITRTNAIFEWEAKIGKAFMDIFYANSAPNIKIGLRLTGIGSLLPNPMLT